MVNGKSKEANKLMKQMARINKKELPEKIELMPTNEVQLCTINILVLGIEFNCIFS